MNKILKRYILIPLFSLLLNCLAYTTFHWPVNLANNKYHPHQQLKYQIYLNDKDVFREGNISTDSTGNAEIVESFCIWSPFGRKPILKLIINDTLGLIDTVNYNDLK